MGGGLPHSHSIVFSTVQFRGPKNQVELPKWGEGMGKGGVRKSRFFLRVLTSDIINCLDDEDGEDDEGDEDDY